MGMNCCSGDRPLALPASDAFESESARVLAAYGARAQRPAEAQLLALFGVEHTREDDGAHALRATAELRVAQVELNEAFRPEGCVLKLSVGIHAGLVRRRLDGSVSLAEWLVGMRGKGFQADHRAIYAWLDEDRSAEVLLFFHPKHRRRGGPFSSV